MKNLWAGLSLIGLVSFAAVGCSKKEDAVAAKPPEAPKPVVVEIVKSAEQSRHFLAVNRQLELGGTLYGYVDIDGDVLKMSSLLRTVLEQVATAQPEVAPYLKQDFAALFTTLGLTDIKAVGFSSVPDGTGFFRNRTFFYTPESRRGLLRGLGGAPAPFVRTGLAPADADVYYESEIDLPAVYAVVREVVAQVGGEKAAEGFEAQLKKGGQDAALSLYNFITGMKGRASMVVRFDAEKTLRLPLGPRAAYVLPKASLVVCIDGIAPALEPTLKKTPQLRATEKGGVRFYEMAQPSPLEGVQPVLAVDGNSLYLSTSLAFLKECRQSGPQGLAQQADFKAALAHVGAEGNGLLYATPRFFQQIHRTKELNSQLPAEARQMLDLIMQSVAQPDRPLVSVRRNLPDGILISSYWNRSLKQDVAMVSVYNPVTIGLMSAMAIPAFQKVRQASQEKAVLNNLRQLAAAADQHYLENGVLTARYEDLVGPTKYIRAINVVAGEDYRSLVFKQGTPLRVQVPSLRKVVEYKY